MSQIIFTICFGALLGWFFATLSLSEKSKSPISLILFGMLGSLVGLMLFKTYIHSSIGGRELYALILSLCSSFIAIAIGRSFTRN